MKIFRVIAADGPCIKSIYILSRNAKKAKEISTSQYGFSNFLIDKAQIENANDFWNSLSKEEQVQFTIALLNDFFGEEIL